MINIPFLFVFSKGLYDIFEIKLSQKLDFEINFDFS
jgi:hypothetical protein